MNTTPREYTPLTVEQLGALHADLHPGRVSKRDAPGGKQLSYMEAYDIKAMLIRVFGYAGFSADVTESEIVQIIPGGPNDEKYFTVLAKATVRITIHQTGVTYTETAAASQSGRQGIGEVSDFALKTAESDALKRAAIYLGTQFGLSLYRNGQTSDVVRRVFAPEQDRITQDVVLARQDDDQVAAAARARLQERLKVHKPDPEPEPEAAEEPAEKAAAAPDKPAAAPRARRASTTRQNAARKALAEAEAAVGMGEEAR